MTGESCDLIVSYDDDVHLVKLSWAESAEMFSEEDNLSLEQVLTNLIFQQGLSSSLTI